MDIRKKQTAVVEALEDVKGHDIVVFNTAKMPTMFERVVIASGSSNTQVRALADQTREAAADISARIDHMRTAVADVSELVEPVVPVELVEPVAPVELGSELVELVLNHMSDALVRGETVKISSFGTFSVRSKSARVGRNPKTGEEVPIEPRRVLTFRPSHIMKERVDLGNKR